MEEKGPPNTLGGRPPASGSSPWPGLCVWCPLGAGPLPVHEPKAHGATGLQSQWRAPACRAHQPLTLSTPQT